MIELAVRLAAPFGAFAWVAPLLMLGFVVEYARWRSRKTGMWADKWPCRPHPDRRPNG